MVGVITYTRMHTHTVIHTTHIHTHTRTHTHAHAHTHTHTHTHAHTHIHRYFPYIDCAIREFKVDIQNRKDKIHVLTKPASNTIFATYLFILLHYCYNTVVYRSILKQTYT